MSASQSTATAAPAATAVSEEDRLRAHNSRWQDTAAGRAHHNETCPAHDHRHCGNTVVKALRWLGEQLVGDYSSATECEARRAFMQDAADARGAELDRIRTARFEATR